MNKKAITFLLALSVVVFVAAGCGKKPFNPNPGAQPTASESKNGYVKYEGEEGKNALELLKSKYSVQTKAFAAGEMVQAIGGTEGGNTHFWSFYVNGKPATVGADQYVTKNGDVIEWKLEKIN